MSKKVNKIISMALMAFFVIMVVSIVLNELAGDEVTYKAWYAMVTNIPFGHWLAEFCLELFSESFDLGNGAVKYALGISTSTVFKVFEDCCILILTAMVNEAINDTLQITTGIKGKKDFYYKIMQGICSMVSVVIATYAATIVLNFLYGQMAGLSAWGKNFIAAIVSLLTVGGAYAVASIAIGASVLGTIAYVGIKMILVNVMKVVATYIGTLLFILFIGEGAYKKAFLALGGWALVIILMIAVDLMMKSMFED